MGDEVLTKQIQSLRSFLDGIDEGKVQDDFVPGLNEIQEILEKSVDEAITNAEKRLTGLGNRKLEV